MQSSLVPRPAWWHTQWDCTHILLNPPQYFSFFCSLISQALDSFPSDCQHALGSTDSDVASWATDMIPKIFNDFNVLIISQSCLHSSWFIDHHKQLAMCLYSCLPLALCFFLFFSAFFSCYLSEPHPKVIPWWSSFTLQLPYRCWIVYSIYLFFPPSTPCLWVVCSENTNSDIISVMVTSHHLRLTCRFDN